MTEQLLKTNIIERLKHVDDPELKDVSVYDLGMVHTIEIDGRDVKLKMIPTFAGCPALDIIQRDVETAINELEGVNQCEVTFSFNALWTTDLITERGKVQLKKLGIAPPPKNFEEGEQWTVDCPYCESAFTTIDNIFGPTACRSILYCSNCKNPFEAMKPVLQQEISLL